MKIAGIYEVANVENLGIDPESNYPVRQVTLAEPHGTVILQVRNPVLAEEFGLGTSYLVEIVPVPRSALAVVH